MKTPYETFSKAAAAVATVARRVFDLVRIPRRGFLNISQEEREEMEMEKRKAPFEPWLRADGSAGILGPEYRHWKRSQPRPVASPLDNNALYGYDEALTGYHALHWREDDDDSER